MRKILVVITFLLLFNSTVFAKEIAVKIKPVLKISTSNPALQEGDILKFSVANDIKFKNSMIKKGSEVDCVLTSVRNNGFDALPASVYMEDFKTHDENNNLVKFKGIIYKEGNDHHMFTDVLVLHFIRGGEVQILPEKDEFTLYLEDNQ